MKRCVSLKTRDPGSRDEEAIKCKPNVSKIKPLCSVHVTVFICGCPLSVTIALLGPLRIVRDEKFAGFIWSILITGHSV